MSNSTSHARVAVFVSGGPIAVHAIEALSDKHHVVAIVRLSRWLGMVPGGVARAVAATGLAGRAHGDAVASWARRAGVPIVWAREGNDPNTARRLASLGSDYGCIATFPCRIGADLMSASGRLCVNLHPSLLPRHRGPDPLFWTYHAGDRTGGLTAHMATAQVDAGPVLARAQRDIGRAEPITAVHADYAKLGGTLLAETISRLAAGSSEAEPQDESAATTAPRVRAGTVYSDLRTWDVEQAWHFLAGLAPRYQDPFVDEAGRPVRYGSVTGFERRAPMHRPGLVVRDGSGWGAWTADGVVHMAPTR